MPFDDFDSYVTPAQPQTTGGARTDRHNNPIAVAVGSGGKNQFTQALDEVGIPWEHGDAFPTNEGGASMRTIRIKGDPFEASRAILSRTNAVQGWYGHTTGKAILAKYNVKTNQDFANLPLQAQNDVINGIYQAEGGKGKLTPAPDDDFDKYTSGTNGAPITPPADPDFDKYVTPVRAASSTDSRGAYMARSQQAMQMPDTGPFTVPREPGTQPAIAPSVAAKPITGYDIAWHLGADPSEMKNWDPKVRKKAITVVQQAVAEDARRRAAGQEILPLPLSRQNQIRAQAGLKPLAAPSNLLPARDVPNLQDIVTEARQSPEAQTRADIRQKVLRKRDLAIQGDLGRTGALIGTPALGVGNVMDRINQVMSPIETVKNLLTPEEDRIDQEVQKQYEAQQRANTPEMIAERTARGEMSAPRRAIDDPVTRFGAGSAKMFAGIASLAGLAPNRVSEYLNAKGNLWDEATQLTPLTPEGKEVVRGLPEKVTATLADMGIGIAQLVAMKKATGLSLSKIMALEAALKTSDAPLGERGQKVAEAATMGRILDGHLGRGATALLFGAPTAVQTGTAAIRGEMSPVEAILQTGLQAGVGAAMGGGEPKAEALADLERAIPRRPAAAVPSEPVLAGLRAVDVRVPTVETAEAFSSPEGRLRAELEAAQAALPQGPLPKGTSRVKRERVRQQQARVNDLQAQLDAIGPAQVAARQSQIESTRYSTTPRFDEWAENQTGQRLSQLDESEVQRLGAQYRAQYGTEPAPPALREMSPLEAITGGSPDAISQREIQSRNQVQLRGIRQRSNIPTYGGEVGQESSGQTAGRDRATESGQVQQGQVAPLTIPVEPAVDLGPGEKHPVTGRRFGSTQVDLPPAVAVLQQQAAARIPDSELAADGREMNGHVTVKYGLHSENPADVQKLLANEPPVEGTIGKISIFPATANTPYDVIKMDVDSPDLHRLNAKIAKGTKVTDTHPTYKPHVTLAYVKPGEGAKYIGQSNELTGQKVTFDKVTFSGRDGQEAEIPLTGQRTAFLHRDLGQVTESPNQKGVPKGRLRVVTEDGEEHLIKRPNGRGQGNNLAIPVRQVPVEPATATTPPLVDSTPIPSHEAEALQKAVAGFDDTGELTFGDFVNEVQRIAEDSNSPLVQRLLSEVETVREAQREHARNGYRMDAPDEDPFLAAVRSMLPKSSAVESATPREVIESAGFKYLGERQFPKGRPSGYVFTIPDGSILAMVGDVTPETLATKLAKYAAKRVAPHPDPDVNSLANDVLSAAANGNLGDLSAAIRDAPPEVRAQLQGLAAEIAKERSSGTQTAVEQQTVGTGSEAGAEVPRPDQVAPDGPAGSLAVPGEPGASGAADAARRPLTWAETMTEVQRRYGETGPTLTGGSAVFDVNKFPKGGLPDHAKILYLLDPVLTKLKADAASLVAAGKLKAEEVSAYIRDAAKDMFSNDPYLKAWNPVNKRAGLAIIARETTPPSSTMDGMRGIIRKAKDLGGIEPIPQMSTAGIGGEGREHASARISVPFVVRDLLSRVFPDQYTDTAAMSKTVDIINKDNILDGYDTFMRRGMDAQIKAATAEAEEKAAIKHRKDLDKNPPAGLTPKDIGQLKMAANNAVNKAHNDAIDFRREAVGWLKDADGIAARPDFAQIEADVNAAKSDPQIVANIARWKAEVNPEMDQLYNEVKRVDPNTPQPGRGRVFGARINLLPESRAAEMAAFSDPDHPMPEAVTSNYRNPNVKRDPFMREARFTGEYSTDPQAVLTNSFGSRMNEVTKIRLVDAITSRGLGIELGPGEKAPDLIQGQKPVRLSLKMPVTNEQGTTTIAERSLWIRPDLAREVRDVLNTDMALPASKVYKFLTQIQLAQLTDITAHLKNVVARLASAPMTKAAFTDGIRQLPLIGHTDAIRRIVSVTREVMSDSPEIRAELAKIAQEGYIRPDYPAAGIQKVPYIGRVFRGGQQLIHTVDSAARISLYRAFDNLVATRPILDTPENRAQYIQAIGEYNRRLISPLMRAARDSGLAPFIVAGKSFNRLGMRMITGNPSVEATSNTEAAKMRVANLASGLVAGAVLPAMLNLATTGSLGGRPGTPVGAWDLGRPEDETGRHRVIDLFQVLGIRRGLRATGLNAAIEGAREGQSLNEMSGHARDDIIAARLHPWLGPGLGFMITAASGKRFDLRSSPTPIIAKNVGGGMQTVENARVALENQNPMLYAVLSPALGAPEGQEDDSLLAKLRKGITKGPASAFGVQDLKSPALKYLDEKIGATMPQVTASGDRQTASKSIISKERSGQSAAEDLQRARTEGVLSEADVQRLRKAGKLTPLEAKIENIHRGYGVEGVLDFYERFAKDLTPEERSGVQKILRRAKLTIATHPLSQRGTADQRAERIARLNKALAIAVPTQP